MGKNKDKKEKFKASPFDYMEGGRISKMGERYGVDKSDYNVGYDRNDGGTGRTYKGGRKEYEEAIQKAATADYQTNRSIEAAALSGKKKATEMAGKGFNNIQDVIKANNMFEKMHGRRGNGGEFSSSRDQVGLTQSLVERERRIFNEDIDKRIADAAPEQEEAAAEEPGTQLTSTPEITAAKERVKAYDEQERIGGGDGSYGGQGSSTSGPYGAGDDQQSTSTVDPGAHSEAQSYLKAAVDKVKDKNRYQ